MKHTTQTNRVSQGELSSKGSTNNRGSKGSHSAGAYTRAGLQNNNIARSIKNSFCASAQRSEGIDVSFRLAKVAELAVS